MKLLDLPLRPPGRSRSQHGIRGLSSREYPLGRRFRRAPWHDADRNTPRSLTQNCELRISRIGKDGGWVRPWLIRESRSWQSPGLTGFEHRDDCTSLAVWSDCLRRGRGHEKRGAHEETNGANTCNEVGKRCSSGHGAARGDLDRRRSRAAHAGAARPCEA